MRAVGSGGRDMVFPHSMGEFEAEHFRIELDGLGCVLAPECGVMKFLAQHDGLLDRV
jgi:hypothetical protein